VIRRVDGSLAVGGSVRIHAGPDTERIRCRFTRVEPAEGFSWRFHERHPLLDRGEHSFQAEALGFGRSRAWTRSPSPASSSRSVGTGPTSASTPA
jgi:hypothetical protein